MSSHTIPSLPRARRARALPIILAAAVPLALGLPALAQPLDTQTGLRVEPRPGMVGAPLTYTATVRAEDGPIAGTVTFRKGDTVLGTVDLPGTAAGPESLAAGPYHACAVTEEGGAVCWGRGDFGQLGTGTLDDKYTPQPVQGLDRGVVAVAVGSVHSCALRESGEVWCWGRNDVGALGDGTNDDRLTPTRVVGLDGGARAISAGDSHSCAIAADDGTAWCWGWNEFGMLGNGTVEDSLVPTRVLRLGRDVRAISAGGRHSCALNRLGRVFCWGANWTGQLGDGTTEQRLTAVPATGLGWQNRAVSAGGRHSCALNRNGRAFCWGENNRAQLGTGNFDDSLTPTLVGTVRRDMRDIRAGGMHSCAVTRIGQAICWGDNRHGQIGDNSDTTRVYPVRARTRTNRPLQALAVGWASNCAITATGMVRCWGWNEYGGLGTGDTRDRPLPTNVVGGQFAAPLARAQAVFETSELPRGWRCVTAHYEGTADHAPSVSPRRCLRVLPADAQ